MVDGRLCVGNRIYWICSHENYRYQKMNRSDRIDRRDCLKHSSDNIIIRIITKSKKFQSICLRCIGILIDYVCESMTVRLCTQQRLVYALSYTTWGYVCSRFDCIMTILLQKMSSRKISKRPDQSRIAILS